MVSFGEDPSPSSRWKRRATGPSGHGRWPSVFQAPYLRKGYGTVKKWPEMEAVWETGLGSEELITVVVPAYNVAPFIERCVMSLLNQTHRAMEVVVVNDRSTDDTGAILDRLAASAPRLHVIHAAANGGPHTARAQGVAVARGAYIGFVDSDDRVESTMYRTMHTAMLQEDADIVQCGMVLEDEHRNYLGHKVRIPERQVLNDDLLGRFSRLEFGSGSLCNKLFRREIIVGPIALTFDRTIRTGEDHIVCVGCFASASRLVLVPDDLYYYFVRSGSITNSIDRASGFALLLSCYVHCLRAYASSGEEVLQAVDVLYARQSRYLSYSVKDLRLLEPHRELIGNTLVDLAGIRPQATYALVHAFDTAGETPPLLPLRYRLGQLRIALHLLVKAILHGRS